MLGISVASAAGVAYAGARTQRFVYVNPTGRYASASPGDARSASDGYQSINCYVYQSGSGQESTGGGCIAVNSSGTGVSCYFPSAAMPGFLKVLATVSSDAWIYFAWDTNGACTYLDVENGSMYMPKSP
jgi:hypothetical protein